MSRPDDSDSEKMLALIEGRLAEVEASGEESVERVELMLAVVQATVYHDPARALQIVTRAYKLADRIGYRTGRIFARGYVGYVNFFLSNHEVAADALIDARSQAEAAGDKHGLALTMAGLAMVQRSLGNFEQALECGYRSLKLIEELELIVLEAWCRLGIAGAYEDMGDYERSITFLQRSLEICDEHNETVGYARALVGMGTNYYRMGELTKALEYQQKSLELFRTVVNPLGESRALNDIGQVHQTMGNFEQAERFYQESLNIRRQLGTRQAVSTSLLNLGTLCTVRGCPDAGLSYLTEALQIGEEIKAKPRIYQSHLALSEAYEKLGDTKQALKHHKAFRLAREEVFSDENTARIKNLQIGFEVERAEKDAEIARLRNVELKAKNKQLEQLLADLKATQARLIQSEKLAALGNLVAVVAHEINSPLGSLKSTADVANRCIGSMTDAVESADSIEALRSDDRFVRCLEILRNNTNIAGEAGTRIASLVDSLKSFSHLDQASKQSVDIHKGIEAALVLLAPTLEGRITVERRYADLPQVTCFAGELNQAFLQLLTNAVQAIRGEGKITVQTAVTGDYRVRIDVSDTGVGLPDEALERLFDPSFSRKGSRVKAGLGLFTTHQVVQKHDGEIEVDSRPGAGTTFSIYLPIDGSDRT